MAESHDTTSTTESSGDMKECPICLTEKECVALPCGRCPTICMDCIDRLTDKILEIEDGELPELPEEVRNQKAGKCPICKKIIMKYGCKLWRAEGRCRMCGHGGMILADVERCMVASNEVKLEGYCDNCWICIAYPETYRFEYECNRCGNFQSIPHPMYRYQPTADTFPAVGGPTWACHQGCFDYTNWRIKADQADKVPNVDKPESWN
jgi:hypothetical protein